MLTYAGIFAGLYLLGERWFADAANWWQRPFQTLGACGVFGLSLLLTFRWPCMRWLFRGTAVPQRCHW